MRIEFILQNGINQAPTCSYKVSTTIKTYYVLLWLGRYFLYHTKSQSSIFVYIRGPFAFSFFALFVRNLPLYFLIGRESKRTKKASSIFLWQHWLVSMNWPWDIGFQILNEHVIGWLFKDTTCPPTPSGRRSWKSCQMKWFHSLKSLTSSKKHWTLGATSDEIRTCNENDEFDPNKPRKSLLNASNKMSPSMSVANLFVTAALSTTSFFSLLFFRNKFNEYAKK
jgi:hypothetical protein